MQAPNLVREFSIALMSPLPPLLSCLHHPGHKKADGGQEDLTMGWHQAGRKCQHLGTLATEGIKSS